MNFDEPIYYTNIAFLIEILNNKNISKLWQSYSFRYLCSAFITVVNYSFKYHLLKKNRIIRVQREFRMVLLKIQRQLHTKHVWFTRDWEKKKESILLIEWSIGLVDSICEYTSWIEIGMSKTNVRFQVKKLKWSFVRSFYEHFINNSAQWKCILNDFGTVLHLSLD